MAHGNSLWEESILVILAFSTQKIELEILPVDKYDACEGDLSLWQENESSEWCEN
jgi:hypothetical protein